MVVLSLLFTTLFTCIQPNLLTASKLQLVDRARNEFRSNGSANELNLGPVDNGDKANDGDDVVVLAPADAEDAATRDISVPKGTVKSSSRINYQYWSTSSNRLRQTTNLRRYECTIRNDTTDHW